MASFWPILEAVQAQLAGLSTFDGMSVRLRPNMMFVAGVDTPPYLCVAPDRRKWESVRQKTFNNKVMFNWPVLVAFVMENFADQANLQVQVGARDAIRSALWSVTFAQSIVTGNDSFDVEYDPNPSGVSLHGFGTEMDVSLQAFVFSTAEQRATVN